MKSIKNYLNACLESLLDDDDTFLNPENDKKEIKKWIKKNYKITGKLTIDGLTANCTGNVEVKGEPTNIPTNEVFNW